jgi:hypothetical protein
VLALPKKDGAVLEPIGANLNAAKTVVNEFVVLKGGGILLDGYHIKNAVLIGVHVTYNGGPVRMENVTFINCQFSIRRTKPGEEFADASIKHDRITFSAA